MKSPQQPAKLVLAHRAANTTEAEIVRSLLADAGVDAMIPDKNTPIPFDLTPLDGEYSVLGCDVLVRSEDLKDAREIIAEAREAGAESEEGDDDE